MDIRDDWVHWSDGPMGMFARGSPHFQVLVHIVSVSFWGHFTLDVFNRHCLTGTTTSFVVFFSTQINKSHSDALRKSVGWFWKRNSLVRIEFICGRARSEPRVMSVGYSNGIEQCRFQSTWVTVLNSRSSCSICVNYVCEPDDGFFDFAFRWFFTEMIFHSNCFFGNWKALAIAKQYVLCVVFHAGNFAIVSFRRLSFFFSRCFHLSIVAQRLSACTCLPQHPKRPHHERYNTMTHLDYVWLSMPLPMPWTCIYGSRDERARPSISPVTYCIYWTVRHHNPIWFMTFTIHSTQA